MAADVALSVAYRGGSLMLAVSFAEQLRIHRHAFGPAGPFSSQIALVFGRTAASSSFVSSAIPYVLGLGLTSSMLATILGPSSWLGFGAGLAVITSLAFVRLRRITASDGAEQMAVLILLSTLLVVVPRNTSSGATIAAWFVGGQCMRSYMTAGISKLWSPVWRAGTAVGMVLGSESHGHPVAAKVVAARPWLGIAVTRGVIVFECSFVAALFVPEWMLAALLIIGALFHISCAVLMGLNSFLVVFPSTYLCVVEIAATTRPA